MKTKGQDERKDNAELAKQKTSLAGWSRVLCCNQLAWSLGARNGKEQNDATVTRITSTGKVRNPKKQKELTTDRFNSAFRAICRTMFLRFIIHCDFRVVI